MHKDYAITFVIGFATALFLFPFLYHIGFWYTPFLISLPVVIPVVFMLALYVARSLQHRISWIQHFSKFAIVGSLNAAIDFGLLNLLSILTGITGGFLIGGVNIPGLLLGFGNSYILNKWWVFNAGDKPLSDIFVFLAVISVGIFINSSIVIFMTTYILPPVAFSSVLWLNIAKVIATAVSMFISFAGFKFFVFKK